MKTGMLCLFILAAVQLSAQPKALYTPADSLIFREYLTTIEPYRKASAEMILEKSALFFLHKPYAVQTLEGGDKERLTVNLRAFDCTTYVESVIALAITAGSDDPSFELFMAELQAMRYRSGSIGDYSSRLHYATDWIWENEQRGLLHNRTASLGGVKEVEPLCFMSTHREAYNRLEEDDAMLNRIVLKEETINSRGGFWYLPKGQLKGVENQIPHMSVLFFTTSIDGLDVTHMGFAFRKEGELTLLHASSTGRKVMVDERSISEYLHDQRSNTGIIVTEINRSYSK